MKQQILQKWPLAAAIHWDMKMKTLSAADPAINTNESHRAKLGCTDRGQEGQKAPFDLHPLLLGHS